MYSRRPKFPHHYQLSNPEQIPNEATGMENLQQYDLDVPIALLKGIRTCTKHPCADYVTFEKLSDQYRESTEKIDSITIPRDIKSALQCSRMESLYPRGNEGFD